ncbi:hypothetical protein [Novosphingobium album (ex Liu et al. 2023)]|uniref:DUF4149 domain-containing protein n=1 Tax=Novosphingobium album (ex Liu et al. 2023) TaxID=3031130 RepID=A0ABT5WKR0_9SPHN|nr:hypothetical protein [Novosphingobium album (ex Liu et al. 2023)]MDE8650627.1 hypothetical protein [Novosphingobium album (ex Liu et al. 2023)]
MDDFTLARVLHIVAIVPWIGGVAFVTTVLMPAVRRHNPPEERLIAFHRFEAGFAWQARIWIGLAGLSGLWMIHRADLWYRFADPRFWWMHAMVAVWAVFAAMLYLIEPLFLHRRMERSRSPDRDFARMERMHLLLLLVSLITIIGAMAGAHGLI